MFELTEADIKSAPTVSVGKQDWPVPVLVARQLRTILVRWPLAVAGIKNFQAITGEQFDAAIDVLHAGLSRAHPNLLREDLLNLPIQIDEIAPALIMIAAQSGVLKEAEDGKPAAGEAKGE
jgi:hypothetical protein